MHLVVLRVERLAIRGLRVFALPADICQPRLEGGDALGATGDGAIQRRLASVVRGRGIGLLDDRHRRAGKVEGQLQRGRQRLAQAIARDQILGGAALRFHRLHAMEPGDRAAQMRQNRIALQRWGRRFRLHRARPMR